MESQTPEKGASDSAQDKNTAEAQKQQDKRLTPRLDIERTVHVLVSENTRIPCTLSDVSKSGARLMAENTDVVPDEFELLLKDDLRKWCRVMRRSEKQVGIKFIVAPKPANPPPEAASPPIAPQDSPETTPPLSPGVT